MLKGAAATKNNLGSGEQEKPHTGQKPKTKAKRQDG